MSRHIRGFLVFCQCSDCDGTGRVEIGVRETHDPETRTVSCQECMGSGEVSVIARDGDFELAAPINGAPL